MFISKQNMKIITSTYFFTSLLIVSGLNKCLATKLVGIICFNKYDYFIVLFYNNIQTNSKTA